MPLVYKRKIEIDMAENQKSKKQVARDYFSSLDETLPLRKRIDDLVEYMKIQFLNGQTERVVFNYIRDIVPNNSINYLDNEIFKNILRHKMDQQSNVESPLCWDDEGPVARAIAVLMIVDLYADKMVHHLGEWFYTNKISIDIKESRILIGSYDSADNGWISKYSSRNDLLKNHFPFHAKNELESPISKEELLEISKDYLGNDGVEIFNHAMSCKGSYKSALDYLETDYYWQLERGSAAISTAGETVVRNKPFILFRIAQWLVAALFGLFAFASLLNIDKLGITGAPILMFWATLASLVGIVIAHSPPMFFRFPFKGKVGVYAGSLAAFFLFGISAGQMQAAYEKTPEGIAEAQKKVDAAEATAAASSGTYGDETLGSYSSSSSTRDSLNYKTQERYDNLSSEGKAYVDDQMQKADAFCARNPDFESCW